MAIINKGKVLLKGNPITLISEMEGKVYQKTIQKNELEVYKKRFRVISEKFFQGKPMIHILSDIPPENDFISIKPDLEHVYFSQVHDAI